MNARTPLLVIALAVLGTAACDTTTGPSSPLAGEWRTLPIPSGGAIDFSLTTAGARVTGLGQSYGLMGRLDDSLTVTGQLHVGAAFSLTLTFGSGAIVTYTGQMVGADQLDGTWTSGQTSTRLAFLRQ